MARQMGQRGRKALKGSFLIDEMLRQIEATYEKALVKPSKIFLKNEPLHFWITAIRGKITELSKIYFKGLPVKKPFRFINAFFTAFILIFPALLPGAAYSPKPQRRSAIA